MAKGDTVVKSDDQRLIIDTKKNIVKTDKRSLTSKANRFKSGKFASLPIYCNNCQYRSEDAGGNGKCLEYEKDAVCKVRDDIKKHVQEFDTRNPDHLKQMIGENALMLQERINFSIFKSGLDGNTIDKTTNMQMNTLFNAVKLLKELEGTTRITATEVKDRDTADFVTRVFNSVSIEKNGQSV